MFRILTNTFINGFRRKKYERQYIERATTEPIYDEVLNREAKAYAANPENHLFSSFFKTDLENALSELREDFRVILVLADIEEFSYKEIAQMLDLPIGTVMSRLHRGRKILQRQLIDHATAAGIGTGEDKNGHKQKIATTQAEKPVDLNTYKSGRA